MRERTLRGWLVALALTSAVVAPMGAAEAAGALMPEHIAGGGFELGMVDIQVHRYPRYLPSGTLAPLARLTHRSALDGAYSLYLPALPEGGYRITPQVMALVPGRRYRIALSTRSSATIALTVQANTRQEQVFSKTVRVGPGEHRTELEFRAAPGRPVPYIVYFWLSSRDSILVDDLSLRGPSARGTEPYDPRLWMEPHLDHALGVYAVGTSAYFVLRGRGPVPASVHFRVTNSLARTEIRQGSAVAHPLGHGIWQADIPLATAERGYFQVDITDFAQSGSASAGASRNYAVITPDPEPSANRDLFGMCMEEHGLRTFISAFLHPRDLYGLVRNLGVGSVRIFSLVMPDVLSPNGQPWDFSQADGALRQIDLSGLSPMFELGSNTPDRIPSWMRSRSPRGQGFDLLLGIGPRPLRRLVASQGRDYLDLTRYRDYLDAVFRHFGNRIPYYEIWNEPAWKFTVPDFMKIVRLTRSAQQRYAPAARLVGFSSTIGGRDGDFTPGPQRVPSFLRAMAADGALADIDVLSYHGAHAFQFFGSHYDRRDLQGGFVHRMREPLGENKLSTMPIWDTEFGIPWTEPGSSLRDFRSRHQLVGGNQKTTTPWDVARQLPMMYAAAMASGVRRLFWFGMAQSLPTIAYPGRSWGLFDPNWQPTPQIPAYNAMTVLLGSARYRRTVSDVGGDRAYVFRVPYGSLVLAYNWQERRGTLQVQAPSVRILDMMGDPEPNAANGGTVALGPWPVYVQIKGTSPDSLHVRVGS